jgi:acid phosphatase (class A)
MKRTKIFTLLLLFLAVCIQFATAQEREYYKRAELPDAVLYLPAPPDTADMLFAADFNRWIWGKSLRPTPRGTQASWESLYGTERMATVFGEAMGITITKEGTPAIWNLMRRAGRTGNNAVKSAKEHYMRVRPFARLNEHVASEFDDEAGLRKNGSYPSGHTALGWATALALAEMLPELQDTILRRGFEYGESRVIVGAHWQSDVDAGRLASSVAVARMHRHPDYARELAAARAEYLKLNPTVANKAASYPDATHILDQPVTIESPLYYGDVAAYWQAKAERGTERGQQAVKDADDSVEALLQGFSEASGVKLSASATPQTATLVAWTRNTLLTEAGKLKKSAFRERPYVRFGEPSLIPEEEADNGNSSSYPSASATLGWGLALVLVEIAPDHSEQILKYGYEYGYSRVIAGYHFASDVQAGRVLAACVLCRMHNDPVFRELLDKAKQEWESKNK